MGGSSLNRLHPTGTVSRLDAFRLLGRFLTLGLRCRETASYDGNCHTGSLHHRKRRPGGIFFVALRIRIAVICRKLIN